MSEPPPADDGTIIRTDFAGYDCARAAAANVAAIKAEQS